ncbi:hypothetical protein D3C76_283800 [compost metagenome]
MKGVKVVVDRVDEVMKALRTMTAEEVLVGVPMDENARDDDPIGNAQIGFLNENGSEAANIPPAPHLVPGVEKVAERCADLIAKGAAAAMTGDFGALTKGYNQAGLVAQASVKNQIRSQEGFDPLSEVTLEQRQKSGFKGTKRLIHTGQYMNSITYVIRKK